jgi:hypothetical protein
MKPALFAAVLLATSPAFAVKLADAYQQGTVVA